MNIDEVFVCDSYIICNLPYIYTKGEILVHAHPITYIFIYISTNRVRIINNSLYNMIHMQKRPF